MRDPRATGLFRRRALTVAAWALVVVGVWVWAEVRGEGVGELMTGTLRAVERSPFGGLWLLGLYLVRPLLLLPITILTVFAGFLFGPVLGFGYSLLAMLVSSGLAFWLARLVAGDAPTGNLAAGLRKRTFETVLVGRLAFLPGDLVNYAAGALRVPALDFLAATAVGGAPGLLVGVLAGSSLTGEFAFGGLRFEPGFFAASLVLLAVSLGVSAWLRRRRGGKLG